MSAVAAAAAAAISPFPKTTSSLLLALLLLLALVSTGDTASKRRHFDEWHIGRLAQANVDGARIRANLRELTAHVHVAGTPNNARTAETIQRLWSGLDYVHTEPYEVLLSYPNYSRPNQVVVTDSNEREIFRSVGVSPHLATGDDADQIAGIQWLAYAANGTAHGDLVYVHYGRPQDLDFLRQQGISLKDRIALIRYGAVFRADKVRLVQLAGAKAAILFSDPAECAVQGGEPDKVFPNSVFMPEDGAQRGTLQHGDGDALTPLYPSKRSLYRSHSIQDARRAGSIPSIPALPVSYNTAQNLLSRLAGSAAPAEWQGGIPLVYRLGPGLRQGLKTTVHVHSSLEIRPIANVIGYLQGTTEPDRYVVLGNHFDAWTYGAIDPNSGTAILGEVVRALVETSKQTGWKPKRTLVFAAWDAEEYGLIGSTEWVEEHAQLLSQRAAVYLNVDCLGGNDSLTIAALPTLWSAVEAVAKQVDNPREDQRSRGLRTLYDAWTHFSPSKWDASRPSIDIPGSGSDQGAFINYLGIPSADISIRNNSRSQYPLYHTRYEVPFLNDLYDSSADFVIHRAVARYWTQLALHFADSPILPINVTELAVQIARVYVPAVGKLVLQLDAHLVRDALVQMKNLAVDANNFLLASKGFCRTQRDTERVVRAEGGGDVVKLERINSRLIQVDRCFVNPRGLPGKPAARHVLYAINDDDSYSSSTMTGIVQAVNEFKAAITAEQRQTAARHIAEQISIVQYSIQCAANALQEFL